MSVVIFFVAYLDGDDLVLDDFRYVFSSESLQVGGWGIHNLRSDHKA